MAAPAEATVVADKPAIATQAPPQGGQPLRDPLVDLSGWEKISQGAEAVCGPCLLVILVHNQPYAYIVYACIL